MLLAERGEIDLDKPASTYLSVPQVSNGVTVRQLLGHRSGIQDAGEDAYPGVITKPNRHWSPQQFLAEAPTPTQPPDQMWQYANANIVVLGLLFEEVAGTDLATAVRRDLFEPLGLARLAYQDAQALPPPLAAPGGDDDLPSSGTADPYLPYRSLASVFGAAGGMSGDALSVARWGYALYGAQLLRPDSVTQITDFDDGDGYGLGTFDYTNDYWYTSHVDGFGHHGVISGYRSVLAVYPAQDLSIAILTPSNVEPLPYVRYLEMAVAQPTGDWAEGRRLLPFAQGLVGEVFVRSTGLSRTVATPLNESDYLRGLHLGWARPALSGWTRGCADYGVRVYVRSEAPPSAHRGGGTSGTGRLVACVAAETLPIDPRTQGPHGRGHRGTAARPDRCRGPATASRRRAGGRLAAEAGGCSDVA